MEPTLLFFRHHPSGMASNALLASSLQAVETSFFLVALERYPHALTAAASAIETCLQAANLGTPNKDGLFKLLQKAQRASSAMASFPTDLLERFREARNRFVHGGFSASDASDSVSLYLTACLPYLSLCFREFHDFAFEDGLLMEYAEQLSVAKEVHSLAADISDLDRCYCLKSFSAIIQWCFKRNFSAGWELDSLTASDNIGGKFERTEEQRSKLERLFEISWSFNCPICDEFDGMVAEIDPDQLETGEISVRRLACTSCDFTVTGSQPYLSQRLLQKQIAIAKPAILEEYGIE